MRSYVESGSENAFETLVARHVNMVHGVALRRVRDREIAKDVTQAVFILLARKAAGLQRSVVLGGWLYRTAQLVAGRALRNDFRRRRRERETMAMEPTRVSDDLNEVWESIAVRLEDAMRELSATDRDAVVLRYLQQCSFAEVAQALGLSEDAAKKRLTRALERLRIRLAPYRAGIGAMTLASVLTEKASPAAPPSVVSGAKQAGLRTGTGSLASDAALRLAGTSVATVSFSQLLGFLALAKPSTLLAASAVALFVGASLVKSYLAVTNPSMTSSPAANPAEFTTGQIPRRADAWSHAPNPSTGSGGTNVDLTAALAKIREALYDPQPTRRFPNAVMQQALAGLGGQRRAAIPILQGALEEEHDVLTAWGYEVRRRAVDGLGQIGGDAADTVPKLLELLRKDTSMIGTIDVLNALERMAPLPQLLPDLVQALQDSPLGDSRQFIAHILPTIVGGDSPATDQWVVPLLVHTNLQVRAATAYALVVGFKRPVGPEIIRVAMEFLKSGDQSSSWMQHWGTRSAEPPSYKGCVTARWTFGN